MLLAVTAGFGYYAIFMSPLAANWILSYSFTGQGVSFEEASGSLNDGLVIPSLKKTGPDYDLIAEGIQFRYSAILDLLTQKKFIIDLYRVNRIELDVKKAELASLIQAKAEGKESLTSETPGAKIFTDYPFLGSFEISEFQVSNVQVRYLIPGIPEKKSFNAKQLRMTGIKFSPNSFAFMDSDFKSTEVEISINGLEIRDGEVKKVGAMIGKLKAEYAPDKMKKDVDYVVKYVGAPKSPGIEFRGFSGKIYVALSATAPVSLVLKNFNYSEYFKESFPISALNAELKAPNILQFMTGFVEAKGSFRIGDIPFQVVERDSKEITNPAQMSEAAHRGVEALGEKGSQKFKITFLVDRFMSEAQNVVFKKPKMDRVPASVEPPPPQSAQPPPQSPQGIGLFSDFPVLAFESNLTKSAQDNFSFLYYSVPYAELDPTQKTRVDQETWIFDKSFPPAPKIARKILPPKPLLPLRGPASVRKPLNRSGKYPIQPNVKKR